jgi:hypothetical protein
MLIIFIGKVCKELVVVDKGKVTNMKSISAAKATSSLAKLTPVPTGTNISGKPASNKTKAIISPSTTMGEETFQEILEAYLNAQIES